MEISDLISIGVIKKVIGSSGKISVIPDTLFPEQYLSLESVFIVFHDDTVIFERIKSIDFVNDKFTIVFDRIDVIEKARSLLNARIMIAEDMLPELREDEYYPYKLKDYMVVTVKGAEVGIITDVLTTPGQEILVIPKGEKEIMIPFCDAFVVDVNTKDKIITIDPIEGLLDAH
ncbi:MAG TPA: 16S rRNA processing protein RimM [Candidatus Cloacimonetes bacterium]|nr:16S rRNA processing protein RimM [Candidatus Cloacimonadota bacterium]HEX37799.1 16S rRNA processing protein RimM [Candidatus Cloacimonadota bacterium]